MEIKELNMTSHIYDTSDTTVIENNGANSEGDCNRFSSDSIIFNGNSIASVIAELL